MNQLRAGAILSYISIFISIIIALVYTPIMIRLLGQAEFGLYSLIGSLAAYFSILDLGLGNAIVRYTARNRAKGDKEFESRLNGTFIILYSIIGLITVIIGLIVYFNIEDIFKTSFTEIELYKAKLMIIILIVNFALSFPLSVFQSYIKAYERFVVDKLISIARTVMAPALILPLLLFNYGSVMMVMVTTSINILSLLYAMMYSIKRLNIKISFKFVEWSTLREIFGYSFFVFLAVIVDQINWNTDQFIIGLFLGTVPIAVYAIAMQFVRMYIQFSTAISGLLLPRASIMVANNATSEELTDFFTKYGRIQYLVLAFILSGFILVGKPFIQLWAGDNYTNAYYILLILLIPLTIPLIQNTGISILYASNLQAFRSMVLIFIAVLNVITSIPMVKFYGGIGAAIATSFSLIVGNVLIMNIYYHRKIGIDILYFWKNITKLSMPMLFALILGFSVNILIPSNTPLFILIKVVVFTIIYPIIMWFLGMNDNEKDIFISMFRRIVK